MNKKTTQDAKGTKTIARNKRARFEYHIEERLEAVRRLEAMSLPVGEPDQMKRESVPDPGDLLA